MFSVSIPFRPCYNEFQARYDYRTKPPSTRRSWAGTHQRNETGGDSQKIA